MFRNLFTLLVAGFCIAGAALAQATIDRVDQRVTANVDAFRGDTSDEHWRSGDGIGEHEENAVRGRTAVAAGLASDTTVSGPLVAGTSQRIESRSEIRGESEAVVSDSRILAKDSSDKADRAGPVPFQDIGSVGGGSDETLVNAKAVAQDQQLQVRGEIIGDELVLQLPAGTLKDTLSLRSSNGLTLSRADVARLGRIDGDEMRFNLSDLRRGDDLGDLWVWGTGPESASLLQRVAMSGSISRDVARIDDIPRAGVGMGTTTLGAPVRTQTDFSSDNVIRAQSDTTPDIYQSSQIDKETNMLRSSGLSKSADDSEQDDF